MNEERGMRNRRQAPCFRSSFIIPRSSFPRGESPMSRILLVEDSPTQARLLAAILGEAGFDVDTAADAEQAWQRLQAGRPDAVLTDLVLPGASGFDLCRRIKADPAHRAIPVIVLTSQADPVNVLHGLEAGAD